jgi:acyl-CoA synthetase (AMP-forming)/AMP-acid ligase II
MKIIKEHEAKVDQGILHAAWDSSSTFAILPDKSGVDAEWVRTGMNSLPSGLVKNHYCLLTSGSTGKPKLIISLKERSEALARVIHSLQENEPASNTILILPLSYSYAFVNQWLWSRVMKRGLHITSGFKNPSDMAEVLSQVADSMVCLVGPQISMFRNRLPGRVFPGVIRVNFAGGPYPGNEIESIREIFPNAQIYNNYGCAEAMPRLTIRKHEQSEDPTNVGRPLPGIEMREDGEGALVFRSPFRLSAYYSDSGLVIVDDEEWVRSGDYGTILETGQVKLGGRSNEVYKRFGEKIALPNLLRMVKLVWSGQAAFYREKDGDNEEGHILVLSPEADRSEIKLILKQFRDNFTRIQWPLRIEHIDKLPLLGNDKIDVNGLKSSDERKVLWRQRF